MHELRTIYSLEDAYLMHESLAVPKYNEWLANERAMRKARSK